MFDAPESSKRARPHPTSVSVAPRMMSILADGSMVAFFSPLSDVLLTGLLPVSFECLDSIPGREAASAVRLAPKHSGKIVLEQVFVMSLFGVNS